MLENDSSRKKILPPIISCLKENNEYSVLRTNIRWCHAFISSTNRVKQSPHCGISWMWLFWVYWLFVRYVYEKIREKNVVGIIYITLFQQQSYSKALAYSSTLLYFLRSSLHGLILDARHERSILSLKIFLHTFRGLIWRIRWLDF